MTGVLWRAAALWVFLAGRSVAECIGDCPPADGQVSMDELIKGVRIVLGAVAADSCRSLDADGDGAVTVDELVLAVRAAAAGCLAPTATRSLPPPSPTPTRVNLPPVLPTPFVYRTFPGENIAFSIGGTDPEGDALTYGAAMLPAGATLDAQSGRFHWTPAAEQLGAHLVPFTLSDGGAPPRSVSGTLAFKVSPLDACSVADCDPATGCETALVPIEQPCCSSEALPRIAEPQVGCPEGLVFHVGRNRDGFGRMQNCDRLRIALLGQGGIGVRVHVETRCITTVDPISVFLRLETADRVLVDPDAPSGLPQPRTLFLNLAGDGYARTFNLLYEATGSLSGVEGQEGVLSMTIMDFAQRVVLARRELRVRVTLNSTADLPETP